MKLPFKLFLISFIVFPLALVANKLKEDSVGIDSREVVISKIENYQKSSEFIYDRVPPPKESWWDSFKRWFWDWFWGLFEDSGLIYVWDYLKWVLIIAALVFIILKIFKTDLRGLFQSKSATNKIHFIAEDEDIHELDFNTMIEDAIAKGNYREAIRLSYLKILKQLTDKDLIKWQLDKTNTDYYHELKQTKYQKPYKKVSLLFEYVWYGEFQVKEEDFKNTMNDFKGLSNLLN